MKNFEVEQKYRISQPSRIRQKLKKLGARCLCKGPEKNELWDYQNKVRGKFAVLRLRETGDKGLLTFKGPRLKSKFKKRVEIETLVDADKLRKIFRMLGFEVSVRYEKYREEYILGKAHITLDYLKKIGWFVEIEAEPRMIEKIAKKLGFSSKDREERSYLEMIYGSRSLWAGK